MFFLGFSDFVVHIPFMFFPFSIPRSPDSTNYPSRAFLHFHSPSSMFSCAARVFSFTVVFIICSIIVHHTERLTTTGIGRSSPFMYVTTRTRSLDFSLYSLITMSRFRTPVRFYQLRGPVIFFLPLITLYTSDVRERKLPWSLRTDHTDE